MRSGQLIGDEVMAKWVDGPTASFTAGAAIAIHLRVKGSSAKLAVAGIADKELGCIEAASFADGDVRAVRLTSAAGTCKMVANGAISQFAAIYTAAAGKVSATAGATSFLVGQALEAATADGDVIEGLRVGHGDTAAT